jgi:molybdopterin synthase sulfur carrier subunit
VDTAASVTLYLPEPLRTYGGGQAEVSISAGTVQAVLDDLERTRPVLYRNVCDETGAVRRHLNIFVNEANVRDLAGLGTVLKGGDVVTIVPAVSGGGAWRNAW